jgi:hypothetical protein
MCIHYRRCAYTYLPANASPAAPTGNIRITIDCDLSWALGSWEGFFWPENDPRLTRLLPPQTCIVEIKALGGLPLELTRTLSNLGIFPISFSKVGRAYEASLSAAPALANTSLELRELMLEARAAVLDAREALLSERETQVAKGQRGTQKPGDDSPSVGAAGKPPLSPGRRRTSQSGRRSSVGAAGKPPLSPPNSPALMGEKPGEKPPPPTKAALLLSWARAAREGESQ